MWLAHLQKQGIVLLPILPLIDNKSKCGVRVA